MEIRTLPINSVEPSPRNPRQISTMEFAGLKDSLRKFGAVEPLVWNEQSNHIVGGNQRLRAMKELGFEEVTVVVVNLGEMAENALNIALNNPGIQGEYSKDVLAMIEEIRDWDLEMYDQLRLFEIEKEVGDLADDAEIDESKAKDGPPGTDAPGLELELYEHYDYIVIATSNIQDWNWLTSFFEIEKAKCDRRKSIGLGRAVKAARAIDLIKKKGGPEA